MSQADGYVAGHCAYKAPELFSMKRGGNAHKPTRGSDVYAFGVLMWEMVTMQIPFTYEEVDGTLAYWTDLQIAMDVVSPSNPPTEKEG